MFTQEEKEKYQKDYLDLCELTFRNNHSFRITTLTVVFQVNKPIDIQKLYHAIDDDGMTKRMAKNSDDFRLTKRRKLIQVFYNQLSLSFEDWSKKVIKVFPNGTVHITGLASLYDFQTTYDTIMSLLWNSLEESYISLPHQTKLVMVNGTVDCGQELSLPAFFKRMTARTGTTLPNSHQPRSDGLTRSPNVTYCPERYPAVKINLGRSSAFIFRTGKLIITSDSLENLIKMYTALDLNRGPIRSHKLENQHYGGYGLKAILNCLI